MRVPFDETARGAYQPSPTNPWAEDLADYRTHAGLSGHEIAALDILAGHVQETRRYVRDHEYELTTLMTK